MTIEELLNEGLKLEQMPQDMFESHLTQYLSVTRPEFVKKDSANKNVQHSSRPQRVAETEAYKKARELAAQFGLKI